MTVVQKGRTATAPSGRLAGIAAALALAGALLAGCSGEGSEVDCSLDACNVTFDRGVDAKASVLGVDVALVGVQNNEVTIKVEDNELKIPVGGGANAEGGGLRFKVQEVTEDKVIIRISREGG